MKQRVVAIVAVAAVVVLVGGIVAAFNIYESVHRTPTPGKREAVQAAYLQDIEGWPYPLPPGFGLPKVVPAEVFGPTDARGFVSFYYQCSWVEAYLSGKNTSAALRSLTAWNDLPVEISSADNRDGSWKSAVLDPAAAGDNKPMRDYFTNCTEYNKNKTSASSGLTIDRPLPDAMPIPTPGPTARGTAADLCAGVSGVPCDPSFGPNNVVDHGPNSHANGVVTLDAAGVPASYKIVSGDTWDGVTQRFGMTWVDLDSLNCYRRDDWGSHSQLWAGDVLNLDPYTVTTVGSQQGVRVVGSPNQAQLHCIHVPSLPPQPQP